MSKEGAIHDEAARDALPSRVAFLGNSYLYFNDVPRLFQALCGGPESCVVGDCLRGGASWNVLLREGNGMAEKFQTPKALLEDGTYDVGAPTVEKLLADKDGWKFVVLNTYSQEAAIDEKRSRGLKALSQMAPLISAAGACPVLMPTAAYRAHAKGSECIGSWKEFTDKQAEGFELYRKHLVELCPADSPPRIADVNRAFEAVHDEREELWRELFHEDDFHPSALGSFLQSCTLYCTIFRSLPPLEEGAVRALWDRARRMLPPPLEGRLPSYEEAVYLRGVAARICDI